MMRPEFSKTAFINRFYLFSFSLVLCCLIVAGCNNEPPSYSYKGELFERLDTETTGLDFTNTVENTPEFHILKYLYFYDGGGVAVGDLNNNGLPDVFLTANDGPNRLFENKGDFRFEDITEQAGIIHTPGSWSTGVTMADVNGDGFLDIYVSHSNYLVKSGRNQLFINNGDMTFSERAAEYGLDFEGYSTQAAFLDYNNDGRLDLFLLNHSFHSDRTYGQAARLREQPDAMAGDRLFRNDGERFTDVTEEAGISSSALGYGLGVAVSDLTLNGYPDIYVGNDFHEDDYLYINNGDGTFTERLYDAVSQTSRSSMGNDIADLTNDGYVDIFSLDMMAEDYDSFMRSGGPDLHPIAKTKRDFGFGQKNARNTMQINRGPSPDGMPVFSEMAFSLGLARTDWSWAALMADFNNSGFKDIFVTNGMPGRPNDLDMTARLRQAREAGDSAEVARAEFEAAQNLPPINVPNYMYQNKGGLDFEDVSRAWGFSHSVISNGAAYADFNNDGQLDLIVNNLNSSSHIYQNTGAEMNGNYLQVSLEGDGANTRGIGAKVLLYKDDEMMYQEQMPTRGFQSSVQQRLHFGIGGHGSVDSLLVIWPDGRYQTLKEVSANAHITLEQLEAGGQFDYDRLHRGYDDALLRQRSGEESNLQAFAHRENSFNDFNREPLMPYKLSTQGPALAVGDLTGNGRDEVYLGGGYRQPGRLLTQDADGSFSELQPELFAADAIYEDVHAHFFDATGNGELDLYVVSGGGQFVDDEEALIDRLYLNEGGRLRKAEDALPLMYLNGAVVKTADINGDGAQDIFIGSRSVPWNYGRSPGSYILLNEGGGTFRNATEELLPELPDIGMVTDAAFGDLTGNGRPELVIAGEWMPIQVFSYDEERGRMENISTELNLGFDGGLWQRILLRDVNGDGRLDIIAGNFGTGSRLQASKESPMHLLINEFGEDGRNSAVMAVEREGGLYPFDRLDELLLEFPFLTSRISSYRDFASKTLSELLGEEEIAEAERHEITELRSGIYVNEPGSFRWQPFPVEAQAFPVMALETYQAPDTDPQADILLGGNLHEVKPGTGGKQGSGYGLHLRANTDGSFRALSLQESGFYAPGELRGMRLVQHRDGPGYFVARNNAAPLFFRAQN
ncbi:MAG: VCBS repeat-containing protein [Cyclonatronaceae bacterium]